MKKLLCLALTITMLLSLSLCFAGCETEDIRGTVSSAPTEPSNTTPVGNQNPTENNKEPEFSMGSTSGHTYKNDFLGISCTLPAEWEFYTDAQILEMNQITSGYLDDAALEQLKKATVVYDMYAQYLSEGSSINVNMEKLNALQLVSLNIKQVLESQISTIKSSYENMGYTDVSIAYEKLTVDGKEFDALRVNAKIQGLDFSLVVFTFLKGSYLANVTVGSLNAAAVAEILGAFKVQ